MRLLCFTLCFLAAVSVQGQTADSVFLLRNAAAFDTTANSHPLFDEAFFKNRYFFFGENHGMAQPQAVDLALLKWLNAKAGVTKYIAEVDESKAWLLNLYLRNGDEALLKKVFRSWVADTAQWANREHYQKWVAMRRYQQSLPPKRRITVVGIDVPQDYALVHEYFAVMTSFVSLGKHQAAFDSLMLYIKTKPARKSLAAAALPFHQTVEANKGFFRRRLGKWFPAFAHLVQSLTHSGNRDKVMYDNLAALTQRYGWQAEKMYGFLGLFHCLQTGYSGNVPFAAHLKKAQPAAGIVSLVMYVLDSETMLPYAGPIRQMMPVTEAQKRMQARPGFAASGKYIPFAMSNDNAMLLVKGIQPLRGLSQPNSVHLFRLSGSGSPYATGKLLGEITGFQTLKMDAANATTLNAFQYVLLFRNATPATPLHDEERW